MDILDSTVSGIISGLISSMIILGVTFLVSKRIATLGEQKELLGHIRDSVAEMNSYYWRHGSRRYGNPNSNYFRSKYHEHVDLVARYTPDLLNRVFARKVEEWDKRFVEEFLVVYIQYAVPIEIQGIQNPVGALRWLDVVEERRGFVENYYKILDGEMKNLNDWRSFFRYPRYANAERPLKSV